MLELEDLEIPGFGEETQEVEYFKWLELSQIEILTGINPRDTLNEKNLNSLMDVEPEELEPILVAKINATDYEGRLINVDGHHRLQSRINRGDSKIKAYVEEFDSIEEVMKKAFTANVKHGIRLTNEEIKKFAIKLLEEKSKTEDINLINLSKIEKEYSIGRELLATLVCQITIRSTLEQSEGTEKLISIINNMQTKILKQLKMISKESENRILLFMTNFQHLLEIATWHEQKQIKKLVELFIVGKITTLEDYRKMEAENNSEKETLTEIKEVEETEEVEKNEKVEEKYNDPIGMFSAPEENSETTIFEIERFAKSLKEKAKSEKNSLKIILKKATLTETEKNNALAEINGVIEEYNEIKKILEQ